MNERYSHRGKDLLKEIACQDDSGSSPEPALSLAMEARGRLPPLFNFEGGLSARGCDGEGHGLFAQGAGDGEAVGGVCDGEAAVAEDGVFAAHLDHVTDKFV